MTQIITQKKEKIKWLAVLQGLAVILVVIGHVTLSDISDDPNYPVASYIQKLVYQFHMALFVFISGYLFSLTSVNRKLLYKDVLKKKASRILYPYVFFTAATLLLKYLASSLVKRPVEISFWYFLKSLIDPGNGPLSEFWFLMVLILLFLLYPLYTYIYREKEFNIRELFLLLLFLTIGIVASKMKKISYFSFSQTCQFAVFFFLGIMAHKHNVTNILLKNLKVCLFLSFIAFILFNIVVKIDVLMQISGIFFVINLALLISKSFPEMFSSYRDYLMQIFLMGIFFQMAIRWFFLRYGNENTYIIFYVISIFTAIYAPVLISKFLQKMAKNKVILKLFSL